MPIFNLTATSAKLTNAFGAPFAGATNRWRLTLTVKMDWTDRLTLATGEEHRDVLMYVNFAHANVGERSFLDLQDQEPSHAMGMLHYFAAGDRDIFDSSPPTLIFDCYIADDQMNQLVAMAQSGRYPVALSVSVANDAGIKYGWAPDGRDKDWDNKTHPR
jgi:hypothetical protein